MSSRHFLAPLAAVAFLASGGALPAADLHVAPAGSDRNPGTREAPLQSLHAARVAARRFAGR